MKTFIIIFLTLLLSISLFGKDNPFKKLNSNVVTIKTSELEEKLFSDAENDSLKTFTLFDASMIASGINNESELNIYREKYKSLIKDINKIPNFSSSNKLTKVKLILEFLHTKVFKKYNQWKTTLLDVFNEGLFNCVSSAALFNSICDSFNIKTAGSMGNIHAASLVYIDDEIYLVEPTTNNNIAKIPESLLQSKIVYNNIILIASIWSNRSAFTNSEKLNSESIINAYKAVRLAPSSKEGIQNIKAAYTSYSLILQKQNNYATAIELTKEILAFFPSDTTLINNIISFYANGCAILLKQNNFDEAEKFINKGLSEYPKDKSLIDTKKNIYILKSQQFLKNNDFQKAINLYEECLKTFPDDKILTNNLKYIYQQWSMTFMNKKQWSEAIDIINLALQRFPNDKMFINNKKYVEMKTKK